MQPREPQHQLEVAKSGDLEGERLRVDAMNTKLGGEVVGDGAGGKDAAID